MEISEYGMILLPPRIYTSIGIMQTLKKLDFISDEEKVVLDKAEEILHKAYKEITNK